MHSWEGGTLDLLHDVTQEGVAQLLLPNQHIGGSKRTNKSTKDLRFMVWCYNTVNPIYSMKYGTEAYNIASTLFLSFKVAMTNPKQTPRCVSVTKLRKH
ncbi:hypothetical protein RRG08_052901 [Elysia crispata]|uniref:Uncharacterized protein n=1 Tax=Elysia crispata TaxID=231223 RepID=A0AAE1DFP8_9GAST|nr:hypothetical protein RRG08_052901 [Elysia crispata]